MYKCIHFEVYELVPREIYEETPEEKHHRLWGLFDNRALITVDRLREKYGPATINDWYWGGNFQFSGWRPFDCEEGAKLSQHKWGRADDLKFKDVSAEEVRNDMLSGKYPEVFEYITCLEMNVSWLHFDVRNWNVSENGILKVYP